MTRSILYGLLALVSVGVVGVVPVACQSGGVGDPCTPEDEYNARFPGYKMQEENIESRSFQCATRICLVNHFQGRVSCPLGQDGNQVKPCGGLGDTSCPQGQTCTASQVISPECTVCDPKDTTCTPVACPAGLTCDAKLQVCTCSQDTMIDMVSYKCEHSDVQKNAGPMVLRSYLCHQQAKGSTNDCQTADGTLKENTQPDGTPKKCCVPGTDTPIGVSVCGQCDTKSNRNRDQAVYCSCRCCAPCCDSSFTADDIANGRCEEDKTLCGPACESNFNYCKCPSGFTCSEIRKNVGLGDPQLTGAYCVKDGSFYKSTDSCGQVVGYAVPGDCQGTGTAASAAAAPSGM